MTPDEIAEVERIVNERILEGTPVKTELTDIESAKKGGAMALFGEKYEDNVRVVSVEGFSKELCGGTHVDNVSRIGPFFVTVETAIASGVRRIEAVTGREATRFMLDAKQFRQRAAQIVGRPVDEAITGLEQLREDYAVLQKELKRTKESMFAGKGAAVGEEESIGQLILVTNDFGPTDRDMIGAWLDSQKGRSQPVVAIGFGEVNDKSTVMAAASNRAVKEFHIDVGRLSKGLLPKFGGRGGGKPSFAQGGVTADTAAKDLFEAVKVYLNERMQA
jgi:alanyl-tRNA synthetase